MATWSEQLKALEADPRFAAMTYERQMEARRRVLEQTLPQDPRWEQMLPQDRQSTAYQLTTRPPVFTSAPSGNVQEILQMGAALPSIGQRTSDQWSQEEAEIAGRAANLVSARRFQENSLLGKFLTKVSSFLPQAAAENLNADTTIEGIDTEEGQKATEYLATQLSNNQQIMTGFQRFAINAAPIAGVVTDVVAGRVAARAPLQAARAAGAARAATATRPWIFRTALPELAESGLDGVLITVNDALEGTTPERTNSALANTAINFGVNVATDMAIFTGLSVVGSFFGALRSTFKLGRGSKLPAEVDDETFAAAIRAFDRGEAVPNELLRALPVEAQNNFKEMSRLGEIGRQLPNVSEADLTEYTLSTKGYRVERTGNGRVRLRNINPARDIEYLGSSYANTDNALEAAVKYDYNVPDRSLGELDLSLQNTTEVAQRIEADIPQGSASFDRRTLAKAITPVDEAGSLNRRNVEIAAQSILAKEGVQNFGDLRVRQVADSQFAKLDNVVDVDNATIFIPEHIRTTADFERFTAGLTKGLQDFVPEGATARTARYVDTLERRAIATPDQYNPMYLESQAAKLGVAMEVAGDQYRIGGQVFQSVKEANDFLTMKSMDLGNNMEAAREAFGRQFGIKLELEGDRIIARKANPERKGGSIISQGSEDLSTVVNDLMQKGYTPKLFQTQGPDLIIDPTTSRLVIDGGVVRGPMQEIVKYSNKYFRKIDTGTIIQDLDLGTISRDDFTKVFRVKSNRYGIVGEFDSFADAKDFLNSKFETLQALQRLGTSKGALRIRPSGDKVMVETIDEGIQEFSSVAKARDYLIAKKVDPTYAKELSGLDTASIRSAIETIDDPDLRRVFGDRHTTLKPGTYHEMATGIDDIYAKSRKLGPDGNLEPEKFLGSAARFIDEISTTVGKVVGTPKYMTFRKVAAHSGMQEVAGLHQAVTKQMKNSRGMSAVVGRLLDTVKRTPGVNDARRMELLGFLERDPSSWEAAQEALGVKLNTADRTFLSRYRDVSERLGTLFGIEPYKLMRNYLPDIRKWVETDAGQKAIASSARASEVLKVKFGSRLPKELEFFSKYMRNTDLRNFASEVDPLAILDKYAQQGIRQFTLGSVYEQAEQLIGRWMAEKVPKEISGLAYHYLEEVMGMYSDLSSKTMEELGTQLATAFSRKTSGDQKVVADFINMMQGLTVSATMSFRAWPIIRNLQQNWLTLAPRVGNDRMLRAMKKIMHDEGAVEEAFTRLRNNGRLLDKTPVFGLENEGFIGKYNKFGMKFYSNSDHVNRIMADFVARDMFQEAAVRFESGVTDAKRFLRESGLNSFDPADQRLILGLMETEGFESALNRYGDILTDESNFTYARGDNPALMSGGTWGRMFGQFGHWPINFRQNVMNQMRRLKGVDKIKFIGRFALNAAALGFTFEKVLGLRADSFKPHKMMFFGGGPYFGLTTAILQQASGDFGAPGWKSIRKDAARLFVPGSLQMISISRAIEEFENGNPVDGMTLMLGLPDLPEPRM